MAIDGRPDGQMLMTSTAIISFALGVVLMSLLAVVIGSLLHARKCPPVDCSIQVLEKETKIRELQNVIKRFDNHMQACKWAKK